MYVIKAGPNGLYSIMGAVRDEGSRLHQRINAMDTQTQRGTHRNTWTAASDGRSQIQPYEQTAGIYVETAGAWQNVGPSTEEHTSARDRARALIMRAVPLLIIEFLLSLALIVLGLIVLDVDASFGPTLLGIILLWGCMGLGSYLWLAERSDHYSSPGVEHARIDAAENIAIEQIHADRDVRLEALKSYLQAMAQIETARDTNQKQIGRGPLL